MLFALGVRLPRGNIHMTAHGARSPRSPIPALPSNPPPVPIVSSGAADDDESLFDLQDDAYTFPDDDWPSQFGAARLGIP
jgi:hypothetical protein